MPTDCNHVQYPKSMAAKAILENSTDANGQPLEVICLPHPTGPAMTITKEDVAYLDVGAIDQHVGAQMAGSYINFYIGNGFVYCHNLVVQRMRLPKRYYSITCLDIQSLV